jgi:hypothetical protein
MGDHFMPLVQLVVVLIVVGVLLGLVNRYIPMAGSIKSILNAVVVIVVVLWLLNVFGLFNSRSMLHVQYTEPRRAANPTWSVTDRQRS